jgi:hypothetical protein
MGGTSTKKPRLRVDSAGGALPEASFPFKRAFVVQFVERAGASSTKFEGRVEHLETGSRASFGSREALLGLFAGMLVQASPRPGKEAEMAEGKPGSRRRALADNGSGDAKAEQVQADHIPQRRYSNAINNDKNL